MTDEKTAPVKYVFLDVEGFTLGRSVEAQADIVQTLNDVVRNAIAGLVISNERQVLLPTGDGICIALFGYADDLDVHLRLALSILSGLDERNASQSSEVRRFRVRIGINQNIDNIVVDINGRRNVAGAGVNMAQRVMSIADGNQIIVSASVYDTLRDRESYAGCFRGQRVTLKHSVKEVVYQFVQPMKGVNTDIPTIIADKLRERLWQEVQELLRYEAIPLPFRWFFPSPKRSRDPDDEQTC